MLFFKGGMKAVKGISEVFPINMGVNFSGGDTFMA